MSSEPNRITIELIAEGPGPPAAIRFRRALKSLLRQNGLRCVGVITSEKPIFTAWQGNYLVDYKTTCDNTSKHGESVETIQ